MGVLGALIPGDWEILIMPNYFPYVLYELPTIEAKRKSKYHWLILDMRNKKGLKTIAKFKSRSDAQLFIKERYFMYEKRKESQNATHGFS
jgi:hypothetical protein